MSRVYCDGHVHIGSVDRLGDLRAYIEQLELTHVVLLSLPLAGADPDGTERINFNPEVLAACELLRTRRDAQDVSSTVVVWGFGSLDNRALLDPGADRRERIKRWDPVRQVEDLYDAGFSGVKLWEGKPELQAALGMPLDDPALMDAARRAGELGMPVLAHVADPIDFWQPGGPYEGRDVPGFEELQRQADAVCDAAPETSWIFPHLLFLAGLGERLGAFLDRHPRAYFDLAPGVYFYTALAGARRIGEPADPEGYQRSCEFFHRYRDRIIAGSDAFFLPEDLQVVPGTSLADNLERFLRLQRFLTDRCVQVSPYRLGTAREHPLFLGLDLGTEVTTLRLIQGENMHRIMSSIPRTSSTDPIGWLERWSAEATCPEARERARRVREILETLRRDLD